MSAITTVPARHFEGMRAITHEPFGADVRSLEDILNEIIALANSGAITPFSHVQDTAASATDEMFIAPADGEFTYAAAKSGAGAGSGESMTFDVKVNGTTVLTGVITVGATEGTDVVTGTLIADPSFTAGDVITVVRAYTAGTPTPMVNTICSVGVRFSE